MIGTRSVPVLGIPIHHVTFVESVAVIDEFIAEHRRSGRSHQVVTVNTDFVVQAAKAPEVHKILQEAALAFADGMPVVWASRVLGAPLPERVAGADWVPAVVAKAAQSGWRVMFYGGAGDSAAKAAQAMQEAYPRLQISSTTGMVGADGSADPADIATIAEFAPDILFVGLGHPKQEHFIVRNGAAVGAAVTAGVGATFQFMIGDDRRAPAWMQRHGLEWLHRMVHDPGRLVKRYAVDAVVFFPRMARQWWNARGASIGLTTDVQATSAMVDLSGAAGLGHGDLATLSTAITTARRHNRVVDVHGAGKQVRRQLDDLQLSPLLRYVSSDRS